MRCAYLFACRVLVRRPYLQGLRGRRIGAWSPELAGAVMAERQLPGVTTSGIDPSVYRRQPDRPAPPPGARPLERRATRRSTSGPSMPSADPDRRPAPFVAPGAIPAGFPFDLMSVAELEAAAALR